MLRSSSGRSLDNVEEEEADQTTPLRSQSTSTSHSRQHSRIHARNLSEFFPRPGQSPGVGYGDTFRDPHMNSNGSPQANSRVTDISSLSTPPRDGPGGGATSPRAQNRRGHHHRHSVSHNLFPFLDPASPAGLSATSPTKSPLPSPSAEQQLPTPHSTFRQRFGWLPLMFQLPLYSLLRLKFPSSQLALLIAFTQMALGATLWIQGQAGESLSVTGLGYLVVFDGLGTISKVILGKGGGLEKWRIEMGKASFSDNLQQPFGLVRLSTLSHFSQAIYLLFSAVYVCKESIEHVLLLHGPLEEGGEGGGHGSGHGAVGHGEGRMGGGGGGTPHSGAIEPIAFPMTVLLLSAILAVLSATCFDTHSELSQAVQSPSDTARNSDKGGLQSRRRIAVFNPFTMTVAGFGIGLFGAALVLPPAQLSPLDKILSLLVSISMFYIAYPAAQATGKILLQTAPAKETREARGIQQGFKDIESHPLILSIESPHVWQLFSSSPSSTPHSRSSTSTTTPTTVVTLTVIVKPDVDEKGMFEVTNWVEERVRNAGNVSTNGSPGSREVTVEVKRLK
ncbi:hypothetical protein JCM3765_005591 [Sporobolomyces pararoseus]